MSCLIWSKLAENRAVATAKENESVVRIAISVDLRADGIKTGIPLSESEGAALAAAKASDKMILADLVMGAEKLTWWLMPYVMESGMELFAFCNPLNTSELFAFGYQEGIGWIALQYS